MGKRVSAAKAGVDLEHRGVAIVVDDRLKAERAARDGERGCNPFRKVLKLRQSAGHAFFDFACAHSDPLMGDRGSHPDRKSVGWGKGVAVRVDLGGRRLIKKKKKKQH